MARIASSPAIWHKAGHDKGLAMRIIAGELGGRSIEAAFGDGMRPAMGRTRESLFSMLEARGLVWAESAVLDLFAGSGALAFEALSRGAPRATLLELAGAPCASIAKNIASLGLAGRCRLIRGDARRFLRGRPGGSYGLVFVDPPYGRGLAGPAVNALSRGGWLDPGAFVAAEVEKGAEINAPESLAPVAERLFGQTRLLLWVSR